MWDVGPLATGAAPAAAPPPPFFGPGDSQAFILWGSVARGYSAAEAALGTTKAFRVVDSGGLNAQDILVLSTGLTDVATLNTWIGAHGTASVTTLYDQVGTNDWTQATVAKMPTITVSGINGLPSMSFNSANSQILVSGTVSQTQSFTFETVVQRTTNPNAAGANIVSAVGTTDSELFFFANAGAPSAATIGLFNTATSSAATAADLASHVIQGTFNNTSSTLNVDGAAQVGPTTTGTQSISATAIQLGGTTTTGNFTGLMSEAGMYAATYNSGVQGNAMTAYGL